MSQIQINIVLALMQISGTIIAIIAGCVLSRLVGIVSQKESFIYQRDLMSEKIQRIEEDIKRIKLNLKENIAYDFLYENLSSIIEEDAINTGNNLTNLKKLIVKNNFTAMTIEEIRLYYDRYIQLLREATLFFKKNESFVELSLGLDEFLISINEVLDKKSIKYEVYMKYFFINFEQYHLEYLGVDTDTMPARQNSLSEETKKELESKIFDFEIEKKNLKLELEKAEIMLGKIKKVKDTNWGINYFFLMLIIGIVLPLVCILNGGNLFFPCIVFFCIELFIAIIYFSKMRYLMIK